MKYKTELSLAAVGLLTLLSACSGDEIRTDYLRDRAGEPLQVPAGMSTPRPSNGEPAVSDLSAEELKSLRPGKLILPPQIVDASTAELQTAPTSPASSVAELKTDANGVAFLQIALPYDQAWSRVHLGLMSGGFTITDINRSAGQLYIRYRDPEAGKGERDEFVLHLLEVSGGSRLLVRSQKGEILSGATVQHLLKLVRDNL